MLGCSWIMYFLLHGMPEVIICDRDTKFVTKFWTELFSILGIGLRFSTAFQPQTNEQYEVTIQALKDFLEPYMEYRQSTLVDQLPLAKFAANNAVNVKCKVYSILFELR